MLRDRIVGLDIGSSGIKLAEFRALSSGGLELTRFAVGTLDIDPQDDAGRPAAITATLRTLMKENGIKPGPVMVSVPGQSVFSRFVSLPPVEKDKVHQMVYYEAQQNVPFPIDEVVWDYQLIASGEGELNVMLMAIKADIIEGLTECVAQAGLETDLVDVASMSLYNTLRYNYGDISECTLVIDMGARSTDLIFVEAGHLFNRSIPVAGNAITQQVMRDFEMNFHDAEALKRAHAFVALGGAYDSHASEVTDKVSKAVRTVMTRMHAEITRSINFYRSQQNGSKPAKVLLTGGSSMIPYMDVFLKEKLGVEVDYLNPFLNVAVSDQVASEDIAKHSHMLSEVVGLGLRKALACPIEINLLPSSVVADKLLKAKRPFFVVAAAGLILLMALWCGYFYRMAHQTKKNLEQVSARVDSLENIEKQLKRAEGSIAETQGKLTELYGVVRGRDMWVKVLSEIRGCLPEGMWLTSVKVMDGGTPAEDGGRRGAPEAPQAASKIRLELHGYGYLDKVTSAKPIIDFRDKLRASPLFSDATEVVSQPAPGQNDFYREYKIVAEMEKM